MTKNDQHVVPNDGGWAVRRTGAVRASRVFGTRGEAVKHARLIARKNQVELYIHKMDGTVSSKSSYGRDPIVPRSRK